MTTYYFAYGSNLNNSDWERWCDENSVQPGVLKFHSIGFLPDWDIAFTFRSVTRKCPVTRKCGVLDLKPRTGQVVPGVIFEVQGDGWQALDKKEGALSCYERIPMNVLDENGEQIRVETYRVREKRREPFVEPSQQYLDIVQEGLQDYELPTEGLDAAARDQVTPWFTDAFFVYGTLLRGESRFPLMERFGLECVILAQAPGQLLDLGSFPGLVNSSNDDSLVEGEFVRLRAPGEAIRELDRIEGFNGFGHQNSLFQRALCRVHVGEGRTRTAWRYRLSLNADQAAVILSGDWRVHRGCREEFLRALVQAHVDTGEAGVVEALTRMVPYCFSRDPQAVVTQMTPLRSALANGVISERKLAQVTGRWAVVPHDHR